MVKVSHERMFIFFRSDARESEKRGDVAVHLCHLVCWFSSYEFSVDDNFVFFMDVDVNAVFAFFWSKDVSHCGTHTSGSV